VAALALLFPVVAVDENDGILSRGVTPTDQTERRLAGSKGAPANCCELISQLLKLDQKCYDAIASLETTLICQETYGIISGKGKGGGTSSAPFAPYSSAVSAYNAFLLDYELGVFTSLSGLDCSVDITATAITLNTFGGWCLINDVITVVTVVPPEFIYTQPTIPFPVSTILPIVPAP
jgi:hypothetical protein